MQNATMAAIIGVFSIGDDIKRLYKLHKGKDYFENRNTADAKYLTSAVVNIETVAAQRLKNDTFFNLFCWRGVQLCKI